MPKIMINGRELEFTPGQTIIEIATLNDIVIPHFCWHPSLTVSGNCRMCLVEIEKMPKLAIACSTLAADGMVVNVDSEKSIVARNAVMEFLLINHPLDCPICDEAGECKLQDYAYNYSVGESRFDEEKNSKRKRVQLGPFVTFDAERCISCSRCIRFCDEIAGENQLTFVNRGDRVTITTYPGKTLDNNYSLNTTDICPVGALTNTDFRFKARVWDMSKTDSICTGCSRGCNDEIWVRNNEALRLTPRFNNDVNSYWMCDYGRINSFKHTNTGRVSGPYIRKEGQLLIVTFEAAYEEAARKLNSYNANQIAFLGSALTSCEDNYVLAKMARAHFSAKNIDYMPHVIPGTGDNFLLREDKAPNALGAELSGIKPGLNGLSFDKIIDAVNSGQIKALYALEDDLISLRPEISEALQKLDLLIVHAVNFNAVTELADIIFPAASFAEKNGTMINFQGRIQRIRPAVATTELDRSLDGMAQSRLDKFGTTFDKWAEKNKKDALPGWKILRDLSHHLGSKLKYDIAEDVFEEMAAQIPELKGLDYDTIGTSGSLLKVKIKEAV